MTTAAEFEACVTAQRPIWLNYARRYMPYQDAEDAVSQAIFKAWRALPRFKGDSELTTWMFRIVTNQVYSLMRKPEARHEHIPLWGEDDIALRHAPETITRTVLFGQILQMLVQLPEAQRHAILMDKAEHGTRPEGKYKTRRFRGIAKVREMMAAPKFQIGAQASQ